MQEPKAFEAHTSPSTHLDLPSPIASVAEQQDGQDAVVPWLTWKAAIMGMVASIGGLLFGFDTGQISGFVAMSEFKRHFGQLDQRTGEYYFTTVRVGLIVGMFNIGNLSGALLAAPIADRLGRKRPILYFCVIYTLGTIVQVSAEYKWYQIVIGRCINGIGVGALSILVPLYTSETSPAHNRGMIVSGYQLYVTIGILIAYVVNFITESAKSTAAWRITMSLDFFWALLLGCGLFFIPESPKYAYRKGHTEQTRTIMSQLLGVPKNHRIVTEEMRKMSDKLEAGSSRHNQHRWKPFAGPRVLYRTFLAVLMLSFLQLTGANFFFYYGTTVFAATGLSNSYITQIILGAVNVACTLPGLYFSQRLSHRKCLTIGALWMSVCFLIFASVGHFLLDQEDPTRTPTAGTVMVVFACLFIAAFASTWGPMSWGESAALCPVQNRATCMAVATAANWVWNFLLAFFTPFITAAIDYRYGYVFAGCCLAMAATTYFFLLESHGRTLEELDTMYLLRVKAWKSKDWVADEEHRLEPIDS
ncbi:general substrate transporter [Glonium stellatum]|uniref:General substrate transporter n=1 Tax=Glonium stellatum TaxID=574774 RepID=A0A8E2EWR3_9PEZI|nr:general substrate transporter [Glonium stellatum]